ncbi:ATP-binding protein [Geodermatophilus sp. SYSU D01106]
MPGPTHVLRAPARPESIGPVHDLLAALWAGEDGIGDATRVRFETAVAEIAANIVEHAAASGARELELRLRGLPDRVEAVFEDDGGPVAPQPGGWPPDDAERGRGLELARAAVDALSYERAGDRNRWVVVLAR